MASSEIEPATQKKIPRSFFTALKSAFSEWFLIVCLFIDAMISYVITKFARGCKLQTPCLICSRLDHVLGKEKMGYYWDLICREHKSEVSSLVLCHAHYKLVDVHKMCENCLFSFATINKSNAETYRLLVGKLGEDLNSDLDDEEPCLIEEDKVGLVSGKTCACCNQPWIPRAQSQAKDLIQTMFVPPEASEFERDHEVTKNERSVSVTANRSVKSGVDHLSHIGYMELKLTSDTESEILPSDDEDGASTRALVRERVYQKREFSERITEPRIVTLDNDLALEKLIDPVLESRVKEEEEIIESIDYKPRETTDSIGHGLEELNWHDVVNEVEIINSAHETSIRSEIPEIAIETLVEEPENSLNGTKTSEVEETSVAEPESEEVLAPPNTTTENALNITKTSEVEEPLVAEPESEEVLEIKVPPNTTTENSLNVTKTSEVEETSIAEPESDVVSGIKSPSNTTTETNLETNTDPVETGHKASKSLDLGDAYKLALDNRGKLSGSLADQWLGKDSSKVTEDLKVLLSQLSSKGGFELPNSDMSPKLSINGDDQKFLEPSSSLGIQFLQKRISLERNESGLSMDGSIISEIDGETVLERLKRQTEHDKKLMAGLYKELEEERNASAVATNQAMAMITRLQEEKAALHMEALQYLRMMEEQAEYDDDELQKSNDLLAEKEKEVQDLEAELEFYKKKFPNERFFESTFDVRITDIGVDNSEYSCNMDKGDSNSAILEFEDEKTYILKSLKKLEKTLDLLPDEDDATSASGRDFHGEEPEQNGTETDESDQIKPSSADLSSLRSTVLSLNKRFEALESDRSFIEKMTNTLRNGDEGFQFIQQIASHLQELRKIATQKDQIVD